MGGKFPDCIVSFKEGRALSVKCDLYIDADNEWTSYTDDGKLSAQWENMILVTEDGCEILAY